jgi:hypothetical protein
MDDDHVAVGEVVLGSEGGGWVEPEGADEGYRCEYGEERPEACALSPGGKADQEGQGVDGEEVAGEEGSAEDGEGEPVGEDEAGNRK